MKKKSVVKGILIGLPILALVPSAGYLYLYNHGDAKSICARLPWHFSRMARHQGLLSTISSLLW